MIYLIINATAPFFLLKIMIKEWNHVIIKTKKGEQEYACRNGI